MFRGLTRSLASAAAYVAPARTTRAAWTTVAARRSAQGVRAPVSVAHVRSVSSVTSSVSSLPDGLRERPFRVLGVQQVAIGSTSRERLERLWVDVFGLKKVGEFASERENVDEAILQLGAGAAAVEVDLMQPLDESKKPAVHVPPLNHLGLWVDDIEEAVAWLEEAGVRFAPGGIRVGASGHKVCFIHPKGNDAFPLCGEGILIELVQAPQDVIDFHSTSN